MRPNFVDAADLEVIERYPVNGAGGSNEDSETHRALRAWHADRGGRLVSSAPVGCHTKCEQADTSTQAEPMLRAVYHVIATAPAEGVAQRLVSNSPLERHRQRRHAT